MEAKCLAEEICKEKQAKQWAGIPHEKLLNQSFLDQLSSLQILEQLAPLQLAKGHLPSDIIDILERLRKADNIPFNQLYYIVENCVDRYYSKVIQTFVSIIKRQFADRQTLLINTAHSLKFLEEYTDRQAQIWKILCKYYNLLDDVEDLHLYFDSFKSSIETNFKHLKEVTFHNVQNCLVYNRHIPPPYAPTSTIFTINCPNCRSIFNTTVCIHTNVIQCRSTPQNMTLT